MPNNRQPHKPPMDRTVATYQMCILAGHIVSVKDGVLCFDPPVTNAVLQRRIEANKAGLIEYVQALPPKTWSDVGRAEEFAEVAEMEF